MTRSVLFSIVFLLTIATNVSAQTLIPFRYTSEDENKLLKENDSVRFYAATGDTSAAVTINEETLYYKQVYKRSRKKIMAEGGIVAEGEGYKQQGNWIQYHPNGKKQIEGSYHHGKPVGQWSEFYADGTLKLLYHYAIISDKDGMNTCISGEYKEYFPDGKLKISGFYSADRTRKTDSVIVEDPVSGKQLSKTVSKSVYTPRKAAYWEYYTEEGELEKREEF